MHDYGHYGFGILQNAALSLFSEDTLYEKTHNNKQDTIMINLMTFIQEFEKCLIDKEKDYLSKV